MKSKIDNCSGCGTKLTFFTKPNFGGGRLIDGGRVCRKCFGKIVKFDQRFGLKSKREYDTQRIQSIIDCTAKKIDKTTNKRNINIDAIQIQNRGIQLLESIYVIDNTKNSDTIKARFQFLNDLYSGFIIASEGKRYISDIQMAIDEYKSRYYDRTLKDYELDLLVNPNTESLIAFYAESLMKCLDRFLKEQFEQIDKLKRPNAIDKRLTNIIDVTEEISTELTNHASLYSNYNDYISEIENIQYKIRERKNHTT